MFGIFQGYRLMDVGIKCKTIAFSVQTTSVKLQVIKLFTLLSAALVYCLLIILWVA